MCLALNEEDPGPAPVGREQVERTLLALRAEPYRGVALVLDSGGQCLGHAFLIAYWSNEYGGEVCVIDELFVAREWRGRGFGSELIESLARGSELAPRPPVALSLEVAQHNRRARALYQRLGFSGDNTSMSRRLPRG
jgi:ribosomal protein S18 acetylase RimI-like enzyme